MLFLLMIIMIVYNMLYSYSPMVLAMAFILSVCFSTYYYSLFASIFMSYMMFLVYMGGLLVLLIYMIMVSMNYMNTYLPHNLMYGFLLCVTMTSGVLLFWSPITSLKLLQGSEMLPLTISSLIVLGTLLLYIFLNVCSTVIVGGRSLTFGGSA